MSASQVSRASRAWRGFGAATFSTLCAAGSHALAGGQLTWLAIFATVVLSTPVCISLAGKLGSFWRIALAIGFSQFLFHWSFSGIGATANQSAASVTFRSPHAHHAGHPAPFVPEFANSPQGMWIAHLAAALATAVLLTYGERAVLSLGRLLHRTALPQLVNAITQRPAEPRVTSFFTFAHPITRISCIAALSYRGPPSELRSPVLSADFSA